MSSCSTYRAGSNSLPKTRDMKVMRRLVMAYLKSTRLKDFYAEGYVRADGRYVHNMYLMRVKTPAESHEPWDHLKAVATMPGDEVFTTKAETRCLRQSGGKRPTSSRSPRSGQGIHLADTRED